MAPRSLKRLLNLQEQILTSLRDELDRHLGTPTAAIKRYQKQYDRDLKPLLKKSFRAISKKSLISKIRQSDVTLVADFHTFAQSQRTFLRLARESVKRRERWYFGIEFVSSHQQDLLDDFQEGRLSLEEFHRSISYAEEWGFPWSHYEPIFEWAKLSGVKLIALNRPKVLPFTSAFLRRTQTEADLFERDRWAAGIITDLLSEDRARGVKSRMLALFGELHLAKSHLPEQIEKVSKAYLRKPLKCLSIHQNLEEVYWKLASKRRAHLVDAIWLGENQACVVSSTPWAKLQSLVDWLEGGGGRFDEIWEDLPEEPDYLSLFQIYGETVSRSLGVDSALYDTVSVQSIQNIDFLDWVENEPYFSPREVGLLKKLIFSNHKIYIPRAEIAFLGSSSHNALAHLAAVHLLRFHNRDSKIFEPRALDFWRLIRESAFGFFGSLLINPRRKCELEADLLVKSRLRSVKLLLTSDMRKDQTASQAALSFLKDLEKGKNQPSPTVQRLMSGFSKAPIAFLAAKYAGQIIGKRMHLAFLEQKLSVEEIRTVFLSPSTSDRACAALLTRLMKKLRGVKIEKSKTSRI